MAPMVGGDDDFEARMDMEALERAEEIRNDPDRVRRARNAARREAKRLQEVADSDERRDGTSRGYTVLSRGR